MKKHVLILLAAIFAATWSLNAQTIVIDEGFENGIQDSVWTQEFVVGEMPWAVEGLEDNLDYPSTVWQGSKRAYLRNTTGETQGYKTRLVSKVMDLSPSVIYQPELTFWYANPKWTADRDTLRVLYKTGANANWRQLAEFSTASADWHKVTLELPEVNATYQIAFEGTDNLGRGIVLDSIKLRSAPECTIPYDITMTSLGGGKVNVAWSASWDADAYDFIVTKDSIDPDLVETIPDSLGIVVLHEQVSGLQQNYEVQLVAGEYYYVYIRSLCSAENSAWNSEDPNQNGAFYFRVAETKYLPYRYGFNMDYDAGMLHRDPEWTWGNNTGNYNPFISTNLNATESAKYSNDGTTCLVFTGANSVTTVIPANQYAYAATPALDDSTVTDFKLNTCQVSFWSTVHTYTGRKYAHSILVGVMTDPEDFTTFVPVDTVSVWGTSTFQQDIVDLSPYQGDGKYVAFASNFDTQNIFYIDNIVVSQKPAVNKVTKISVNPRDTYASISWEGNAKSYDVMVTNALIENWANIPTEAIVERKTVTTNSFVCEVLEADHSWDRPYYVYVKAEGAWWSNPYPFVTIAGIREMPMTFDMEQQSGIYYIGENASYLYPKNIGIFSNDPDYPRVYTTNPYRGKTCLYLSKDPGNDSWITFPMVDSLQNKQMTFYLSGSSNPSQVHATVGVMTNPMDINTFVPISSFKMNEAGYMHCYTNFANYEGEDGVIAIVWSDVEDLAKNTINYIDEVVIEPIASCLPPVGLEVEAFSDSIALTWDKSANINTWEFIVATQDIPMVALEDTLSNILGGFYKEVILYADTLVWDNVNLAPEFGVGGLDWYKPYFIYIRSICGDDMTWWVETTARTTCAEMFEVPYTEGFERGEGTNIGCWQGFDMGGTGYPKIMTSQKHSGNQSLELWSTGTTHRTWIVAPEVNIPVEDMMVEFYARSYGSSTASVLYTGFMTDPTDSATFVAVDTFYIANGSKFYQHNIDMSPYKAYQGQYLAITTGLGTTLEKNSDVYIDDISIKSSLCGAPYNIEATDVDVTSMDIKWDGRTTDKWEVKVLDKYAVLNTDSNTIAPYAPENVIMDNKIVDKKELHIDGLKALTRYYIYIRPTCGDSIWAVDSIKSGCQKINPNIPNKETFENYPSGTSYNASYQADCWYGANYSPTATTSYLPYIHKSTTYANSGNNSFKIYGYSSGTTNHTPAWAVTPEIDCETMNDLFISFTYYMATTSTYTLYYGVMIDPEDLTTFTVLDSLKGKATPLLVSVDMSEYADSIPDGARYFAWRTPYDVTTTAYIDDVSVIRLKCPMAKPSYSALTSSSVRINSGLRTNDQWHILVTTQEVSADSLNTPGYVYPDSIVVYKDIISARSKVVTGLKEQTDYYVTVASACEGENPYWTQPLAFTTPCNPVKPEALGTITFSKEEGYETGSSGYLPCWVKGSKYSSNNSYKPYVGTTTTYMRNGNYYLYIYNYITSSANNDGAYAIMPALDVDSIKDYQVNFFARSSTTASHNNQLIIGVITDPSDLNTFAVVDTLTLSKEMYEPFSISLEDYMGDYMGNQGKHVMFLAEFGVTNSAYVSEISIEKTPACPAVTSIEVDSIGEDLVVVSFEAKKATKARLLLAPEEVADTLKADYQYLMDTIVTSFDSVVIDGLNYATNYYLYAQVICGADTSDISMAYARFYTNCPETDGFKAPYFTDFDSNSSSGTTKKPDCWSGAYLNKGVLNSTQTYPYVYKSASYAYSDTYVMYMYATYSSSSNYECYAVAPLVQGNLNNYLVSFYARKSSTSSSYGGKLMIGYVTDADPEAIDSTFVLLDSVMVESNVHAYYEVELLTKPAIPAGARLAIRAAGEDQDEVTSTTKYATMYIDNFRIGLPPSCYPPTLEPRNSTLTTAEVIITPYEEGNKQWQLAVIPDSIYENIDDINTYLAEATDLIVADSVNFVVSGLTHGTTYQVHARTLCGGDDGNSAWTDKPITIRTKYYYKDSYTFGFEKSEGWIRSHNSTSDSYYLHPALEVGYYNGENNPTSYSYFPYSMENSTSAIYAYGPADGSEGEGVLRWNVSSTNWGSYIVFPSVEEAHDRSFEFKLRSGYLTKSTMKPSTTADVSLEIGTIEKGKGYETYEVLAVVNMPALDKTIVATAENNYLYRNYTLDLDSATIAKKQVVLRAPKHQSSAYPYIDDVVLGAPKGYGLVSISDVKVESSQATITWEDLGAPWNLYITTLTGDTIISIDTVATFTNLTTTSQVVTGLTPQTDYTAILVPATVPASTKYELASIVDFTTLCLPIEPDANGEFFWNFNDPNDWEQSDMIVGTATSDTAYHKPSCFVTGTTYTGAPSTSNIYYNWLIQRKGYAYTSAPTSNSSTYAHYEYGLHDSPALRVYTTSSYMTPYIVLPELNCSFDSMMIEFYGRCFANYDATHATAANRDKIISTTYLGDSYSQSIVVGTLTDPHDFSTLQVIDTLTYQQTNLASTTKMHEDPTGMRYWEKMQLPLADAKGKYIVLFQPKHGLFFIDNLSVKNVGDNIFTPSGATVNEIGIDTATVSWRVKHPSFQTVVVLLDEFGVAEVARDTIVGNTYTFKNLTPATKYEWYVYQFNGGAESGKTGNVDFTTDCLPIDPSYTTSFEINEGFWINEGQTSDTYKRNICWTYSKMAGGSTTNVYNYASTTTAAYGHSGAYAVRFYGTSTTHPYIAMPAMDTAAYDTLQINFWMRPAYHNPSTGLITTQYTLGTNATTAEYYYAKSIIVGTMTDPEDPETFMPIDTITYDGTIEKGAPANISNDFLFQKKKVALRGAKGAHVAFVSTVYAKGATEKSTYNYVWLDDISFSELQECAEPKDLEATNIGADEATVSWTGKSTVQKYVLQVSTDYDFYYDSAFVYNDTVSATTFTVTGLQPFTTYAWRVQAICGEELGESEFTQNMSFTTARVPFFLEDFRETSLDGDWSYGTTPAIEVIDSADVVIEGDNSTSYGFKRVTTNYGIYGAHYAVPFYSSSSVSSVAYDHYWLISPSIYLASDKNAHFTWDMALTAATTTTPNDKPLAESNMADDYTFMVVISDDGGKTWKSENAKVWNNTLPAGQQLRDVPQEAENMRIDLSKFAGKNIRVAFYREAQTYNAAGCAMHIGNIRVAYYDNLALDTTACQYQDIEAYGFFIDGDKAAAGNHEFTRIDRKGESDAYAGMLDTVYNLTAQYYLAPETIITDTICEGDSYTSVDFTGKTRPGVYRHKMQSVLHCDSIVTLYLNVTPTQRAEDEILSICPGESYTWNDKEYNRAGIYRDTLVSSLGCDSIETLVLSYLEQEDTIYASSTVDITELPFTYQNEQYPYAAGQTPIFYPEGTPKGVYTDVVMVQGITCNAVLVHTLTVTDRHDGIDEIMDALGEGARKVLYQDHMYIICNDKWYTATGQRVSDPRK